MSQLAALAASLEADLVDADDDTLDMLAVLGTCVSRMLSREMRRHEILDALFPEEDGPAKPIIALGRATLQTLLEHGMTAEELDQRIERLLRHAS
jgi:hypothetical protein